MTFGTATAMVRMKAMGRDSARISSSDLLLANSACLEGLPVIFKCENGTMLTFDLIQKRVRHIACLTKA